MTTPIRQTTTVQYQGLDVTIIGELDAGLLAIAGYNTPHERAIAAITARQRGGRRMYRLAPGGRWTPSLEQPAVAAVRLRQATDQDKREGPSVHVVDP